MRNSRPLFLATLAIICWLSAGPTAAEQAKPYKAVAIQLPQPVQDASFIAFRKQLVGIAERKDRGALAKIIVRNFFWMIGDKDATDHARNGIENMATALDL